MTIKPIKTQDFILRPYESKDALVMAKLLNNRNISKWIHVIPYPYNISDARRFLKNMINEQNKSVCTKFGMAIDLDNKLAGSVEMFRVEHGHMAEIGYWLGEPYWGQGIMTEVIRKFCTFTFREFRLKRIYAHTFPGNIASERVLEKNGFAKEGAHRKYIKKGNRYLDCNQYAKIK